MVYFCIRAGVMELADVTDSKSVGLIPRAGSTPATGTKKAEGICVPAVFFVLSMARGVEGPAVKYASRGKQIFPKIVQNVFTLVRFRVIIEKRRGDAAPLKE